MRKTIIDHDEGHDVAHDTGVSLIYVIIMDSSEGLRKSRKKGEY